MVEAQIEPFYPKQTMVGAIWDHTTIMNLRHLLEKHKLGRKLFKEVNNWLSDSGINFKEGTIVDAKQGLVHGFTTTPANEHDLSQLSALIQYDSMSLG